MDIPAFQELTHLPPDEALQRRFDGENYRALKQLAIGSSLLAFLILLYDLLESDYFALLPAILVLVLARWVFASGEKDYFQQHFRGLLPPTILAFFGLLILLSPELDMGLRTIGLVGAMTLVAFRLPTPTVAALAVAIWAGTLAWPMLQAPDTTAFLLTPRFLIQTAATLAAAYFAVSGTRRERLEFARRFRVESSRNRERLRMREELDSARQIQLSMLPRRDPKIEGLDIASVSLPATEVGGDYFEYFPAEDQTLAVVIADVAGHGVASGLLLSGVRSCLYLLNSERPSPVDACRRLDPMVRATTDRRMFITLLLTVIDPVKRTVNLVTAGHPPMLHYRAADRSVVELGDHAPPLGTNLNGTYNEVSRDISTGDVLLLYTDGLTETVNRSGDSYGDERLQDQLRKAAAKSSAREVRESILSSVWTYKGDGEQLDDITMVVIRVT